MARFLNAKDVAYDNPGSVANYYGWNYENILPQAQSLLSGGEADHQRNMRKHVDGFLQRNYGLTYDQIAANPNNNNLSQLVNAVDYAVREEGRKQQTKGGGFLDFLKKAIGPAVGALVLPGVGAALGAPLSAAAGGAIGGAVQGGVEDGIPGALIGSLSGYGIGSGIGAAKGFLAGTPLSNVNQFMPADIAARAGTTPAGYGGKIAAFMGGNPSATSAAGQVAGSAASAGGSTLDRFLDTASDAAPLISAGLTYLDAAGQKTPSIVPQAQAAESNRQALRDRGVARVNEAFDNQDPYYDKLRSSIFDYQTADLDRDYGDQQRELKFELARRGHLGGSQEVDNAGELKRLYNEGRLNAGAVADDAVRSARQADQAARAQAIQDIYLDVDSGQAVSSALTQSRLASDQAADYAKGQNLGDVFNKFAYLYTQNRNASEQQRAARDYGSRRVGIRPASTYAGSTA